MKTPANKTLLILSLMMLAFGGSMAAQSRTKDQVRKRAHRIFAAQTGPDQVTLAWDDVPGTTEYRIYLPDPKRPGPPAPGSRPLMSLSGSGRQAIVTGVSHIAAGAYLEALGQDDEVLYRGTFNAVARAPLAPPAAPAAVQARETGETEVTLSWNPVPGATAYMILRAMGGSGWQMLCNICPPGGEFVDDTAIPGLEHTYSVAAIFPLGISNRTQSKRLTVGAAQLAAASKSGALTSTMWDKPMSTGTPVAGTDGDNSNVGASTGTPITGSGECPPDTGTGTGTGTNTGSGTGTTAGGASNGNSGTSANPFTPGGTPAQQLPTTTTSYPSGGAPSGNPGAWGSQTSSFTPGGTPAQQLPTTGTQTPIHNATPVTTTQPAGVHTATPITTTEPAGVHTATPIAATTTSAWSAEYQKGKSLNPGATGYPEIWDPVAAASGMTSAERVAAWKEIEVVALEYKHILGRQPTSDETRRDVAALKAGTSWKQLWRQLAHSAERDTRFGYWAAAPLADPLQAQKDFGLAAPPWTSQQCFGGLGPKCDGGIPELINNKVSPIWSGAFYMPDNTQLAYVEIGVAVGSVLHDNACLKDKGGLNCNGLGAGDLIKTGLWPAGLEWNKASWNVIDQRTWRQTFGPYPTDPLLRDFDWYDDLRPAAPRPAMMAPAISVLSWPGLTVKPTDGETRQTRALKAPAGTSLDDTDVAFCGSGAFGSTGWFIGKASWGICK